MTSQQSYFRQRAICRKIIAEGTGLAPERMTNRALYDRMEQHIGRLLSHAIDAELSSPELVRAIVELDAMHSELYMRGTQLSLPV